MTVPPRRGLGVLLVVLVLLAWWGSAALVGHWLTHGARAEAAIAVPPGLAAYDQGSSAVARAITPSVVLITAEEKASAAPAEQAPEMPEIPEPFRRFFTPRPPGPRMGAGSGLVLDSAGYILTNFHVAGNATRLSVRFANGDSYPATLVGGDQFTDLAVIKINAPRPLTPAALGDADRLEPGAWVMAAGYPFGERLEGPQQYEPTVTVGVVSATHRQNQSDMPGQPIRDLLQTDAPINPGNSGGPLVNSRGEVIGVNQSIYTSGFGGGNIGVGFAIAVNARTRAIIAALRQGQPIVRGQLGVSVEPLTPTLKRVYHATAGVFVNEVNATGPAAKAGMKDEDIIVSYNGTAVTDPDELVELVHATRPGTTVPVVVLRGGQTRALQVTVSELAAVTAPRATPTAPAAQKPLGLTVEGLSAAAAKKAGVTGVRVSKADPYGDAARAGVEAGDIIVSLNGQPVDSVTAYTRAVAALRRGEPAVLRIWREGHMYTAQIESVS